ncbi:MAG: TRAP transporter large permease subunit, partial [Undibacterium sp.]|nr:TRAP transporter large permease subunit [Undibacterium sp.]
VLAFFLDFFELAFILVPLVGPVAEKMGIDLIWFGVLLGVNMQTSFMHPPFGFALFYLRSVAPKEVKTSDIYWGAIPFVVAQIIMVSLIIAFPNIVSVEKKRNMTEDVQLNLTMPVDDAPSLNLPDNTDKPLDDKQGDKKDDGEEEPVAPKFTQ